MWEAVCSDSLVCRSGEVELPCDLGPGRPFVAIPRCGGGLGGVPCDDDEAKRSDEIKRPEL